MMRVLDPGHRFLLDTLDATPELHLHQELVFVKREGPKYPGNVGHYPGTNLQECWRAEISRLLYLDAQVKDYRNDIAINNLRHNILLLEQRAAERHSYRLDLPATLVSPVESISTCKKCGHICCIGNCHASPNI